MDWQPADEFTPLTYERVVGLDQLYSIAWLSRGLELAATVCRLVSGEQSLGTGFLIAPDMVMTNCHVLPDASVAATGVAEFNFQQDWAGHPEPTQRFELAPERFWSDRPLDCAVVGVRGAPGALFGHVDLSRSAMPTVNDYVTIVQHPNGGPKAIGLTDNKVSAVFDRFLQYTTDTEPGSSGSPVWNQQWEIVGLHHAGGNLAGPDGAKHFTNEGILMTAVVAAARSFLGLPEPVLDLCLGPLRGPFTGFLSEPEAGQRADELGRRLLRERAPFRTLLGQIGAQAVVQPAVDHVLGAGVACGVALRVSARAAGHNSVPMSRWEDVDLPPLLAHVITAEGAGVLPATLFDRVRRAVVDSPELAQSLRAVVAPAGDGEPATRFLLAMLLGAAAAEAQLGVLRS